MISKKEIEKEITQVRSLNDLTEIYGEIAASRMKKIRGFVLKNREFMASIDSIFRDTLSFYAVKISEMIKSGRAREGKKLTFLAHNGKTVSVLISANTGFYGDIVRATFNKFIEDIAKEDVEVTIIGRVGKALFMEKEPKKPYTYFEIPDYGVDLAKISEAIKHLVQYEKIKLYYGKYQSVVTQRPTSYLISAGTSVSEKIESVPTPFIFEPSVEKILMFFETQIFASLFDQSIRESQLSKYASRILAMDRASDNIGKKLTTLKLVKLQYSHRTSDRKQINSLSPAFSLVKG